MHWTNHTCLLKQTTGTSVFTASPAFSSKLPLWCFHFKAFQLSSPLLSSGSSQQSSSSCPRSRTSGRGTYSLLAKLVVVVVLLRILCSWVEKFNSRFRLCFKKMDTNTLSSLQSNQQSYMHHFKHRMIGSYMFALPGHKGEGELDIHCQLTPAS